jgi:hypothetical protein
VSSITLVLGAGFSQALGIPGTREITDRVDTRLEAIFTGRFQPLRDRLRAKFHDSYNFEVLAAALEACEPFGAPHVLAPPYPSVLPEIATLQRDLNVDLARALYETLMGEMVQAVSDDWRGSLDGVRRKQIHLFFESIRGQHDRVEIATLNYDLGAEDFQTDYTDGFVGDGEHQYFESSAFMNPQSRVRIGHLHGCIAYGFEEAPRRFVKIAGKLEPRRVMLWTPRTDGSLYTGMITGSDKPNKLVLPPYSVYYAWLADQLLRTDRLVVIGYGVADVHVNAWLTTALQHNPGLRCVIVDYIAEGITIPQMPYGLYAYASGAVGMPSAEEWKALQFDDGIARDDRAMLVRTGFPLSDSQLAAVLAFLKP